MPDNLPRYRDLPALGEDRHAWDVWGRDDQLGTINLLTPERVRHAATLVRSGRMHNLSLPLDLPSPPLFGRQPYLHTIFDIDRNTRDDRLENFHPQASSQWDGLRHVRYAQHGFWGGRQEDRINGETAKELGIEHFAEHGIAGRGVLIDVERWARAVGRPIAPDEDVRISVEDLDGTVAAQGVSLVPGDIVLLRTGWLAWYLSLDQRGRESAKHQLATPGIESGSRMAEWIWDQHIAVFAGDNPALEHIPGTREEGYLHRRILPALGLAIGEMWDFESLAGHCAEDGVYEFMVVGMPLNLPGGVGSPANALALK
jgi:kynurenine formamidase